MTTSVGLRLKQPVLAFGVAFLGVVALTNLMTVVVAVVPDEVS